MTSFPLSGTNIPVYQDTCNKGGHILEINCWDISFYSSCIFSKNKHDWWLLLARYPYVSQSVHYLILDILQNFAFLVIALYLFMFSRYSAIGCLHCIGSLSSAIFSRSHWYNGQYYGIQIAHGNLYIRHDWCVLLATECRVFRCIQCILYIQCYQYVQ